MSAIDSLCDADVACLRSRVEELQREVYRLRLGLDAAKKSHVTVDTSRQRDLPFDPPIPPGRGEAASNPIEQAALALYAADDEAAEATRRFDCAEYAPGEVGSFSLYETYLSACAWFVWGPGRIGRRVTLDPVVVPDIIACEKRIDVGGVEFPCELPLAHVGSCRGGPRR